MALSAAMVWEVRTTASADTNGGAFRAGATGTDYSQQNSPQVTYTDLVIDGATNTKLTSVGNPFTSAHVGNTLYISSGTNFTVARYEVVSVSAGVATMDKAVGTVGATAGNGYLGGALASLTELSSARGMVGSNRAFVKSGTYSISAALTFAAVTNIIPGASAPATGLYGYNTTRGDMGFAAGVDLRPVISVTTTSATAISSGNSGWDIQGFVIQWTGTSTGQGVSLTSATFALIRLVKVSQSGNLGIAISSGCVLECEIDRPAGSYGIYLGNGGVAEGNYIHDGTCSVVGIRAGQGTAIRNTIANLTTAGCNGINLDDVNSRAFYNTIDRVAQDGIQLSNGSTLYGGCAGRGNLITRSGRYGLNYNGTPTNALLDGNAYYSNTSGNRSTPGTSGVFGVGAYVNSRDQDLSGDPYANVTVSGGLLTNADYRLNATAGAGAQARGAGQPSSFPGLTLAAYPDFGAIQHQDAGGGTTNVSWIEG